MSILSIIALVFNFVGAIYGIYKVIECIRYNKVDLTDNVNHASLFMILSFSFSVVLLFIGELTKGLFDIYQMAKMSLYYQIIGFTWVILALFALLGIIIIAFKKSPNKKLPLKRLFNEVLFTLISGVVVSLISLVMCPSNWWIK